MQNAEKFSSTLRELRGKKGLSQQQLAERMMVSRSAVSMWELGSRLPDISMFGRLADCLGVEQQVLLDAAQGDPDATVNILVAEDIPALLQGAVRLIESELPEANITGFESSAEALDYARLNRVSVAFLDIELDAEMDGLELARRLTEIYPRTNIIFLTNFAEYMTQAIYDHCSGYILKPLNRERVRHELANLRFPVRGLNL